MTVERTEPNSVDTEDAVLSDRLSYTALLAGATGLVGTELLKQLIHDKRCSRITVIARKPLVQPIRDSGPKLNWIVTSFDRIGEALQNVEADVVFCALGTTIKAAKSREAFRKVDLDYPLDLAHWAKRQGARAMLVISSMGASERSAFFYNRVKGEMEAKLGDTGLPSLHVFRPSLLLGKRKENRSGERVGAFLANMLQWAWIGPLRRYKPIRDCEVAFAMRAVAADIVSTQRALQHQTGKPGVHIYESDGIARIAREMEKEHHANQ
jgi:uncharacterized protein YbjT (DUF2867 family)